MRIEKFDSGYLLANVLPPLKDSTQAIDSDVIEYVLKSVDESLKKLAVRPNDWQQFSAFWPPRLVEAYISGRLVPFFGAGLSISSGIPSWTDLLVNNLGIDKMLVDDPDVSYDPLTLAELVSQQIGANNVQNIIRTLTENKRVATASHFLVATLRCPINITTNYDILFETAWKHINPLINLEVVTNDGDLALKRISWDKFDGSESKALLFKIHGSSDRNDEHLVLTRKDYRHHYRSNNNFFKTIRQILRKRHILFMGFSHRDPEVTRLVEDAIYDFEKAVEANQKTPGLPRPHFYSLQFDMKHHTPEIFAARGLVALKPPIVSRSTANSKSAALSTSLAELIVAGEKNIHSKFSLDIELQSLANLLSDELTNALRTLSGFSAQALNTLDTDDGGTWLNPLLKQLGIIAGQGVYLVNAEGRIVCCEVPVGLDKTKRLSKKSFFERPYFRQSKTFRKPFVSDTFRSVFNGLSTIALCLPIIHKDTFRGLLFSAAQVGAWNTPIEQAKKLWAKGLSLLLLDSNGLALMPPNNEFPTERNKGVAGAEDPALNLGYSFDKMISLSRRDSLISHIVKNIVPLTQDDDIYNISTDLRYYTVVTEIRNTRWKIGISMPLISP